MDNTNESRGQIAKPADPALETRIRAPSSEQLEETALKRRFKDFTQGATGAGPADYTGPKKTANTEFRTIYEGLYR